MDAAARRVRPADLARLAALRERREDQALREARIRAAARDAAQDAAARAEREVAASEAGRREGERAFYDGLSTGGAIGLAALETHRSRLDSLSEAVVAAAATQVERARQAGEARAAHERARAVHAARARETRKWDKARGRILSARRAAAERAEECETEDETLMRIGTGGTRG